MWPWTDSNSFFSVWSGHVICGEMLKASMWCNMVSGATRVQISWTEMAVVSTQCLPAHHSLWRESTSNSPLGEICDLWCASELSTDRFLCVSSSWVTWTSGWCSENWSACLVPGMWSPVPPLLPPREACKRKRKRLRARALRGGSERRNLNGHVKHSKVEKEKKLALSVSFPSHVSIWPFMDTGRPITLSAVCARFAMRVAVPTAGVQEINLPVNPEACRETRRETGWTWWQWAEQTLRQMEWQDTKTNTSAAPGLWYDWCPIMTLHVWESSQKYTHVTFGGRGSKRSHLKTDEIIISALYSNWEAGWVRLLQPLFWPPKFACPWNCCMLLNSKTQQFHIS